MTVRIGLKNPRIIETLHYQYIIKQPTSVHLLIICTTVRQILYYNETDLSHKEGTRPDWLYSLSASDSADLVD